MGNKKILDLIEKHERSIANHKKKIEFHENRLKILKDMLNNTGYSKLLTDERWLKKRKEIFEEKGYICSKCGSTKNLQVHHLYYEQDKNPWDYPNDALIVLCKDCHEKTHDIYNILSGTSI